MLLVQSGCTTSTRACTACRAQAPSAALTWVAKTPLPFPSPASSRTSSPGPEALVTCREPLCAWLWHPADSTPPHCCVRWAPPLVHACRWRREIGVISVSQRLGDATQPRLLEEALGGCPRGRRQEGRDLLLQRVGCHSAIQLQPNCAQPSSLVQPKSAARRSGRQT